MVVLAAIVGFPDAYDPPHVRFALAPIWILALLVIAPLEIVPAKVALIGSILKALVPLLLKKNPSLFKLSRIIAPVESVDIILATALFGLCKISLLPLLTSISPVEVIAPLEIVPAKVAFCELSNVRVVAFPEPIIVAPSAYSFTMLKLLLPLPKPM